MAFRWATKDPDEVLDYSHDWTLRLDGDTISGTPSVSTESGTITVDSTSTAGAIQTVWLSGGVAGTTVALTLGCVTVGGRTYEEGIRVKIAERHVNA